MFAYSGLGSGIVFDCNIQEKSFAPTQVDQGTVVSWKMRTPQMKTTKMLLMMK